MSIRLKIFFIIAVIGLGITISGMIISISAAQGQLLKILEVDMQLAASMANEYISGEIDLLKANAAAVSQILKHTRAEEMQRVLIEQVAAYEHFQAITVFNAAGKIEASYGTAPAAEEIIHGEYGRQAYEGRRVISTSYPDSSGYLVFHVFVPIDDYQYQPTDEKRPVSRVVVCTVPGSFFSERLNRFLIWQTGNITMGDHEGTIIANVHQEWVMERVNFLELAKKDNRYEGIARAMRRMTEGAAGTDRFIFEDIDVVVAYMPITASEHGWFLAIIVPIEDSPFYKVQLMIVTAGIVFLVLGLIAAGLTSGSIAKPFYQLEEQNEQLIDLAEAAKAAAAESLKKFKYIADP